jgi:TolA-binding protein
MATASHISNDPAFETSLFWEQYKTLIIAVLVVLVLGGLGYTGFRLYSEREISNAAALLAAAKSPPDFQQIIARYPGTQPAASAYLLLAESQREKKQYAEANATFHKFIDQFPKHELITTAWMGVAANLDSLGKPDEALSTYQRLVAEYPQSFNAPLAMLSEVSLLKAKNRMEEARRVCETLLTQYRESILASEAMRELRALNPPASAQTAKRPTIPPPAQINPPSLLDRPPEAPASSAAPTANPPQP